MKYFLFLFLVILSVNLRAQSNIKDTSLVLGYLNKDISAATSIDRNGFMQGRFSMNENSSVFIIGAKSFKIHTGKIFDYYEIAYRNKPYFVYREDINLLKTKISFEDLLHIPENIIDTFRNFGLKISNIYYLNQKLKAYKFIESCKDKGLLINKKSIFDESEYTDGTGFSCTIENLSNKTIKYISFSLVGYNSVHDKILERGVFTKVVKGVGPIAKNEIGTYSFNYVWFTDLVESFDISSIKIQYMDGSVKVISNPNSITLSRENYDLINEKN